MEATVPRTAIGGHLFFDNVYIHISIYIHVDVCVCVRERERVCGFDRGNIVSKMVC